MNRNHINVTFVIIVHIKKSMKIGGTGGSRLVRFLGPGKIRTSGIRTS